MGLLIFGLLVLTAGFFAKALTTKVNIRAHCADLGQTHAWIYKELDHGHAYMVCQKCKHLPGGDKEAEHYYQHPDGG